MSFQELKEQVIRLPVHERLSLVTAIVESLQELSNGASERSKAVQNMRGLLKTPQPALSDEEVAIMLEARRLEKYL